MRTIHDILTTTRRRHKQLIHARTHHRALTLARRNCRSRLRHRHRIRRKLSHRRSAFHRKRRTLRIHECLDLTPRQRTCQITHHPPHMKNHRTAFMHIVHEENPIAQTRDESLHRGAIKFRVLRSRRTLKSVEHTHLVALGLQTPQKPPDSVSPTNIPNQKRALA